MRVFVSSSFEDLREHRAAAIRVLRQLGHDVVAMEDLVAGAAIPLKRVLEDVKRSDIYVGIFAWRYGFVPKESADPSTKVPDVAGAVPGTTSITHYEYLQAKALGLDILAFLLDESHPWPPHLVDGFVDGGAGGASPPGAPSPTPGGIAQIRALRSQLQLERVVSYFTTPSDLEARVGAAVTVAGMSKQVRLNLVQLLPPINAVPDSDPYIGIRQAMRVAGQHRVLQIDLGTTWWSTRLYLTAYLADRLTNVRRFVVVHGNEFVGVLSTRAILATMPSVQAVLRTAEQALLLRTAPVTDPELEMGEVFTAWNAAFPGNAESTAAIIVTPDLLRRWFCDSMLDQAVRIADLARASIVDLLRMLDYPNDFVPVVSARVDASAAVPAGPVKVVDKAALNAQLAQSYVIELMDRARLT